MMEHRPVYTINGHAVVLDTGRETLYQYIGKTRNVRTIALADAVEMEGGLLTVHVDGTEILLQHNVAGIRERYRASQWLNEPVILFDQCQYVASLTPNIFIDNTRAEERPIEPQPGGVTQ